MPTVRKRGRPRKDGHPKGKSGQAAARRYYRARKRFRDGEIDMKIIKDFKIYLTILKKRAMVYGKRVSKFIPAVEQELDMAVKALKEKRAKNVAKRNTKGSKEAKENAAKVAAEYADIVLALRNGEEVEGFTLLTQENARKNSTVDFIIDVDNGQAICKYK